MTDVLCYSTVAGELPKLCANNIPMCFASWSDYINITNKLNSPFTNQQKESILKSYLSWVDQVAEDNEDKCYFSAEELVRKVIQLCEDEKSEIY